MKVSLQVLVSLGCLMVGMAPGRAQAQEAGTRTPVPHEQVLSANPFLLLWEWVNIEYERKMSLLTDLKILLMTQFAILNEYKWRRKGTCS